MVYLVVRVCCGVLSVMGAVSLILSPWVCIQEGCMIAMVSVAVKCDVYHVHVVFGNLISSTHAMVMHNNQKFYTEMFYLQHMYIVG